MVRFEGNIVGNLHEIDGLQNGQSLANRGDTYFFQVIWTYHTENFPSQVVRYSWDKTIIAEIKKRESLDL
jgi:hypothetical protein